MQKERIKDFLAILSDRGFDIQPERAVLDLGCGDGVGVKELRDNGYMAYGCDIRLGRLRKNPVTRELESGGIVRVIQQNPYKLPFGDETFDFIISYQVFEHVKDYPSTISEICRLLKPGGATLHIFPSLYRIREPHVGIPFGSLIQQYWWVWLWIKFGLHGELKDRGFSTKDIATKRHEFLKNRTNYLSKSQIYRHFSEYFSQVHFCEREAFRYSPKATRLYSLILNALSPSLISPLFSSFGSRVVLAVKR